MFLGSLSLMLYRMILIIVLVFIIAVLILQLQIINEIKEVVPLLESTDTYGHLDSQQRKLRREIFCHTSERDKKREQIEKKYRKEKIEREEEIENLTSEEVNELKQKITKRLQAATIIGNQELIDQARQDLRILNKFIK